MKLLQTAIQTFVVGVLALFVSATAYGQKKLDRTPSAVSAASDATEQIHLKLKDGTIIAVDEAWESGQGIWYRRGGMSHLVSRDRVKAIDRGVTSKPRSDPQVANVIATDDQENRDDASSGTNSPDEQPVWIYLVGGAKFEVDNVTESASGAWYRRGPLSVFVERARIDHIEREQPTLADSKRARGWTTGSPKIDSLIKQNGAKYGVDPYLIFCVMEQESHFNTRALSPKGARGLMQLMPGTSARLGVRRPSDPAQNIAGGTRYLKQLMGQFNGRIDLVLASYNAGEGAVMKFGRRVPPYRETRAYVKRISYRYHRTRSVVPKSEGTTVGATSL